MSIVITNKRRLKIRSLALPFFILGFLSALACGLVSGIHLVFVFAIPGVITGCLSLIAKKFAGSDAARKYGFLIFFLALFSTGYSYLYNFFSGGYFSVWELIHVCGACSLLGYGILLYIHVREFKKNHHDEDGVLKIMKITVAAGFILFMIGIGWLIIIIYYYARFLYWPLFWIITMLSSVYCLGAGVFSILLIRNMKRIVPLFATGDKSIFPLFRYVLTDRFPGFLFVGLSILCMAYQTVLFPLIGI